MRSFPGSAPDEGSFDAWEAEGDFNAVATSECLAAAVRGVQAVLTTHVPVVTESDWADVVIDLPEGRGKSRRSKVRFRRFKPDFAMANRKLPAPSIADAVTALDLSRSADSLLRTVGLREIIKSADTGPELRLWSSRSSLFDVPVLDFLADSDAEERFVGDAAELQSSFLELGDIVNAFTILVHEHAQGADDAASGGTTGQEPLVQKLVSDPGELLRSTTVAQIVLNSQASPALRKVLSRSELFRMSVQDFLEENDAELMFRDVPGMGLRIFCELGEIVTEFTSKAHSAQRRP